MTVSTGIIMKMCISHIYFGEDCWKPIKRILIFVCREHYCFIIGRSPHYNVKRPGYARGFHIELEKDWFTKYGIDPGAFQGSFSLKDPYIKNLIKSIYRELQPGDDSARVTINGLLLQIFGRMIKLNHENYDHRPQWLRRIVEILRDNYSENFSLAKLSSSAGVHPVYLSYAFQKHFKMTIGQYARLAKVEAAKKLLDNPRFTLTEISYMCGFSDQSHFIRIFKSITGLTPGKFRRTQNKLI